MKTRAMLWVALILGAGFFVYFGLRHIIKNPSSAARQPANATAAASLNKIFESRADEQGEVSVEVRPIKIDPSSGSQFEINLNTHTVEIDGDLTQVAYLSDDQSRFYRPIKWEGTQPGGHHRDGVLSFGPLDSSPKFVELKIKNIGNIPERIFKWELK